MQHKTADLALCLLHPAKSDALGCNGDFQGWKLCPFTGSSTSQLYFHPNTLVKGNLAMSDDELQINLLFPLLFGFGQFIFLRHMA